MLIAKEIDGELWVKASDAQAELAAEKAKVENDLEVERMRLAACSAAALGYFNGCKEEYRSASLEDVLALNTKIADLTAQLAAKESAEQEPVARVNAEGFIVEIGDVALANGTKLYTSSPTTSAAVAAFRRKAAEVCRESSVGYSRTNHDGRSPVASYKADACDEMAEEIAALPANDSALREICVAVAKQANYCSGRSQQELEAIVNEVLGK